MKIYESTVKPDYKYVFKKMSDYPDEGVQFFVTENGKYILRVDNLVAYVREYPGWDYVSDCEDKVRKLNVGEKITLTFEG